MDVGNGRRWGWSQGLSLLPVASEDEALRMLRAGQLARKVAEHQFNHVSSRQEMGVFETAQGRE